MTHHLVLPLLVTPTVAPDPDPDAESAWAKLVSWWVPNAEAETFIDLHGPNDLDIITDSIGTDPDTGAPADGLSFEMGNYNRFFERAGTDCVGLDDASAYELAAWAKSDTVIGALFTVASKTETSTTQTRGYALHIGRDDGDPNKSRHMKGRSVSTTYVSPTQGAWVFFGAYRNGTDRGIALNAGSEVVTQSGTSTNNSTSDSFRIGPRSTSDVTNNSHIGTVAFFNDVLTADERTYLYNGGAGRTYGQFAADAGA